ncbi:hypothetical protein DUNSADRAFT_632, partial [Dunaliella salina]
AHPRGESPLAHQRRGQQGAQKAWADGGRASAGAHKVQTPAVVAAASGQPGAGTSNSTGDPRTWPLAKHAAQGHQGMGVVDVILEEPAEGEEEEEGGEGEGAGEHKDLAHERQKPGFYHIMRRAPHHITTATTPYLMGLPLEVLASMEQVPCLADVVARQIWHPPRQALNPAEHQKLCEQVKKAVDARKQRVPYIKAARHPAAAFGAAAAAPTDAWQTGLEPLTTSSLLEESDSAEGDQARLGGTLSPGGQEKGESSPSMPASPTTGTSNTADKVPNAQKAGKMGTSKEQGVGLIKRRPGQGLESQLGWDNILRGPQRATCTDDAGGDGEGTLE